MKAKLLSLITIGMLAAAGAVQAVNVDPPKDAVPFRGNHYKAFLDTNLSLIHISEPTRPY